MGKVKKRSIILIPDFKNINTLQEIREAYDPLYSLIPPHITLVFPFTSDITTAQLYEHVSNKTRSIQPFDITLSGITGTPDHYLFLNVKQGNDQIISLHDLLYSDLLAQFKNNSYTYLPHITVGRLATQDRMVQALKELQ